MKHLRPVLILATVALFTLPLMLIQAMLVAVGLTWAKRLPTWYHRWLCRILGVRLHVDGKLADGLPVLLLSNHISWMDIPVLSTLGEVSFVAKAEVQHWPVFGWLAKLQRTVFVNRERRNSVGKSANQITQRLAERDHIVIFPEGTSGDGNHILPFNMQTHP